MLITKDYLKKMEDLYYYNSASTSGFCKKMSYDMVKALVKGESLIIEDQNLTISSIEEYIEWKKPYEYLNGAITEELITRAEKELFPDNKQQPRIIQSKRKSQHLMVTITYLKSMENLFQRDTPSTRCGLRYLSYELVKALVDKRPLLIEEEGRIIRTLKEFEKWKKTYKYLNTTDTIKLIDEAEREILKDQKV